MKSKSFPVLLAYRKHNFANLSEPKLEVSLEGPFKMKAETKLSLTPSKCDDIEFFGEKMNACAEETITQVFFFKDFKPTYLFDSNHLKNVLTPIIKNMQVKVTLPRKVFKLMFARFDFDTMHDKCVKPIIERDINLETSDSENIEMKILFTKFDSSLRAELDSSAANYVMTFKFDKK